MISEAITKQIDSVYVSGIGVDANAHTDVWRFLKLQIGDAHVADPLMVEVAAGAVDPPGFQKSKLCVGQSPPLRRQMAIPSAAVAWRGPGAEPFVVDLDRDITWPVGTVHGGFGAGFKGKVQPVDLAADAVDDRKTVFKEALLKPQKLRFKALR